MGCERGHSVVAVRRVRRCFFFQAEDGIRDGHVTGVQTCALPIFPASIGLFICVIFGWVEIKIHTNLNYLLMSILILFITVFLIEALPEEFIFRGYIYRYLRSEERRVGKEWRFRWSRCK